MPDKTKVLHLVAADCEWEPAFHIAGLAASLREQGLTSAITAPEHSRLWDFAEAAGVATIPAAIENSINPLRWRDLAKLIKESDAGVVHVHGAEAAQLLGRARVFLSGVAVVSTRYDLLTNPTAAEFGGGVGAIVCPSRAMADVFARHNAPREKLHVVPDGVGIPLIDHAVEERDRLRIKYRDAYCPDKEKPLFAVNIAPLDDESGQPAILEAMAEIVAALPQTHLFIMGEGPLRPELERQVRIMALERDVTIMEPDRAFTQLLAATDLYVSASVDDVSGGMVQTAMVAGRAVALYEAGCYPELIEDGKSGAFAGHDAQSLRTAMLELLENRTRREHLGRLAKARALKLFDLSAQAGRIAGIYAQQAARGE